MDAQFYGWEERGCSLCFLYKSSSNMYPKLYLSEGCVLFVVLKFLFVLSLYRREFL
jgi:hypothetical protein